MRDYGTGGWEGGDETCDHLGAPHRTQAGFNERYFGKPSVEDKQGELREPFKDVCGKCGARRVDQQLGLEPTPDQYVQRIVHVFREVRRVLAPHGTCWVNLGDSYASQGGERTYGSHDGATGRADAPGPRISADGLKPKDLVGIPWRVAFALQADGWWLRSDIIWAKPNPMPESVTDRPTKAHEYVFLLTKQPRYWFDQEAVREPHSSVDENGNHAWTGKPVSQLGTEPHKESGRRYSGTDVNPIKGAPGLRSMGYSPSGRNVRTVWTVATQPYPEAHFATYPEELVRRCVLAGCPVRVCVTCGKPSERIVESEIVGSPRHERGHYAKHDGADGTNSYLSKTEVHGSRVSTTVGWSDCGHNTWRPGVVLDPFIGSGTTAKVARDHGRHSIGIDLSEEYLELAARRLQQQSLFSEASA